MLDSPLTFKSIMRFILSIFLIFLNLFMTSSLHLKDFLVDLLLFIFLSVFFIHVPKFCLSNKIISHKTFWISSNFSFPEVIIYVDSSFVQVEFSLSNLSVCRQFRVKSESLRHLKDHTFFFVFVTMIILNSQVFLLLSPFRIKSNTSVNEFVFPAFVSLKCFSSNLFFSVN